MELQPQPPYQKVTLPNATAVLVLGIISIVGCFCYGVIGVVCGIIALVLARKDLTMYNASPDTYTPSSYANLRSGRVCAIVGLSISALYVLCLIAAIVFYGTVALSHPTDFWHG